MWLVGACSHAGLDGTPGGAACGQTQPTAVVMDIHPPVLNGVPATTLIKMYNPFTVVIGLTAGDPHEDEKAMTIAGASAVISKNDVLHALHPAIVSAATQIKKPI